MLVVGGARGTTGAAALAARAAFRADAGYVAIAAPADALPTLETLVVEAVKRPLESAFDAAERASALALGPGLGRDQQSLVRRLLEQTDLPAVVDADALYELEPFERAAPTVLTPHSGELARLLGEDSKWVDAHRLDALRRAVERFGCVVLLKGADTLVGAPGEGVWVVGQNVPALATAGTGDVLTGIVAAFLAKGMDARQAAAAAAVLAPHAPRAARERGPRRERSSSTRSGLTSDADSSERDHGRPRGAAAQRPHAPARARRRRAVGRRQSRRLRARRGGRVARQRSTPAPTRCVSRRCRRRSSCAARFPATRILCMGPREIGEVAQARARDVELAVADDEIPEGRARAPQARHRDGPVRARRAP